MMNIKVLAPSAREMLKIYIRSLSNTLPPPFQELATSEIALLVEFILLPPKYHWARFSSPAKTYVGREYNENYPTPLTRANMNNKLYSIYGKGYLRKDEDRVWYLNSNILKACSQAMDEFKNNGTFTYTFSIQNEESKGTNTSS